MLVNKENMETLADATVAADIKGRSLWQDAWGRFQKNKAAVVSVVLLAAMVLLSFVGPAFAPWSYEEIDWNVIGSAASLGFPSLESGHYFGTDDLGRDIYARTLQGTQISLLVGLVGTGVAVTIGVLYGAVAGYVGGRIDNYMMRFVDISDVDPLHVHLDHSVCNVWALALVAFCWLGRILMDGHGTYCSWSNALD
jgi:oligopeptide transport system permease protein